MINNIDSFYATIDIEFYDTKAKKLLEQLEIEKLKAKELRIFNTNYNHIVDIGNLNFKILPNGDRGHAYILHNYNFEMKLSQVRSKNYQFYPVTINIRSHYIWSVGIEKAWETITSFINESIGPIRTNKIKRLDLCCHTDQICITEENINNFKGKYRNENIQRSARIITGVYFGTRQTKKIYARIYNKSREILKSNKYWFNNIWSDNNLDLAKVWNVEFELKRGFFKEIHIDTVEEALIKINDLWNYLTREWLILTNNDKDRIERSEVTNQWAEIQSGFQNYQSIGKIERNIQKLSDNIGLLPLIHGCLSSYSANLNITNLHEVLVHLELDIENYLYNTKSLTFKTLVRQKIKLKGGE